MVYFIILVSEKTQANTVDNRTDNDTLIEALLQERDEMYIELSRLREIDHGALEKAEKMDNQRFCDFFRGDKSFPSQVFANEKVKELYCDHCK